MAEAPATHVGLDKLRDDMAGTIATAAAVGHEYLICPWIAQEERTLSGYQGLRHHHNVQTMLDSRSFMDQERSELHASNWRQGKVIRDAGVKVFQIETTVNNACYGVDGPMAVFQKREWEWNTRDRARSSGRSGLV